MADHDSASSGFAALAAELQADHDETITAQTIVTRLVEAVEDADEVSLTLKVRDRHVTLASTGPTAEAADELQYAFEEGPCVEAAEHGSWFRSGDVSQDHRWPRWGPAALGVGVRSLLSVQLLDGGRRPLGALNLYSGETNRFSDHDTVEFVLVYAIHAATALTSARLVTGLQTALTSRHSIGMAQGMLMERYGLTEQQSFDVLRRFSSSRQLKLREVAEHLVATRRLPGDGDVWA